MAQSTINIRMDESLKTSFNELCDELGLTMSTAFTIFAKKMVREQGIPFDVSTDSFYSKANTEYLTKIIRDIESGKSTLTEHELIED